LLGTPVRDPFKEIEALRDEIAEVSAEIWSERVDLLDRIHSYPESLERDKALVEQLGKQWDIVKAEADDLLPPPSAQARCCSSRP
jgi:ribosome-binding ATPase YchF (GTP1/OBG family)